MPESQGSGTGSNEGEDLFEDLDKFFAPIQDVDWPETSDPAAPAPVDTGSAEATDTDDETTAFEEPIRIDADEAGSGEDADAFAPTPGQESLLGGGGDEPMGGDEAASMGEEPAWASSADAGDTSEEAGFLFGESDDDPTADDAITEEAFAQAPTAYVDLPQTDEDDAGVAELLEDDAPVEERPDLDAVEAAADHFAESVREEVRVPGDEPSPVSPTTEEVEIAALLGDEPEPAGPEDEPEPRRTLRVGPEGLGGPSWQEPTAVEVGADQERRGGSRNVPMAFLTGLILAAVALASIAIGSGAFAIVAGAAVLFAQGEFYLALQKRHYQPATALGLVAGALVLAAGYYRGESAMIAMVALGAFASFLWYMTVPMQNRRNVVSNVALTVLGIVYIPMLAAYVLALLRFPEGRPLVISIIGLTIAYDVAAFGVGSMWGMRPLAPNVSPKKSLEGAVGATLVVIGIAIGVVAPSVDLLDTLGRAVGLAVVVAIFAPLGDLAESVLKRDLGLKDMGSVLPGHGGVLDRIDAILFVAPAAFMFLRLILL